MSSNFRLNKTYLLLLMVCILNFGFLKAEFFLGADDIINIEVTPNIYFGDSNTVLYGGEQRVDPAGNIHLKLIGDVNITGMTPSMLSSELESRYSEYLIEPEVTIKVVQVSNSRIIVAGEVKDPGIYTLNREISVVEAIQLADGTTNQALLYDVKIIRGNLENAEVISCNVDEILKDGKFEKNVYLQSGDILYVPQTLISKYNDLINKVQPTLNAIIGGSNAIDHILGED